MGGVVYCINFTVDIKYCGAHSFPEPWLCAFWTDSYFWGTNLVYINRGPGKAGAHAILVVWPNWNEFDVSRLHDA